MILDFKQENNIIWDCDTILTNMWTTFITHPAPHPAMNIAKSNGLPFADSIKRNFHLPATHLLTPINSEKSFKNPNFVNESNPNRHNYVHNYYEANNRSTSGTNDKSNSNSSLIINKIKQSQPSIIPAKEEEEVVISEVEAVKEHAERKEMCNNRKRMKTRRGKCQKHLDKGSKHNNHRKIIHDMMEVEIFDSSSLQMDISNNSLSSDNGADNYLSTPIILADFTNFSNLPVSSSKSTIIDSANFAEDIDFKNPQFGNRERQRQASITESEDSFIVFDDGTDEECNFSENSEESDEDEGLDDNDDNGEFPEDEEDAFDSSSSVIPSKRVRFADDHELCEIHPMVQWSFAYQAARKGPWEEFARDRERFRMRINNLSNVITPILDQTHRKKIYAERFTDN